MGVVDDVPAPISIALMHAAGAKQHAEGEGAQNLVDPVGNDEQQQQPRQRLRRCATCAMK